MHYLLLFAIVFAVGIIPAFGPPSWVFAVFFRQHYGLSVPIVVLVTALATTLGRLVLAVLTKKVRSHIPAKYVANLEYSRRLLTGKKKSIWVIIGLFVLSPLPSAQLFETAGLMKIPLLPLGLAFFVGRVLSLSVYVGLAHLTTYKLDRLWEAGFSSVWAIVAEVLTLACIVILLNLKWIVGKYYQHRHS